MELTEEQNRIVAHDEGPALVFAVAGAGKTTAMVHRIARLIDEELFAAKQILATSFNKEANRDIVAKLKSADAHGLSGDRPWPDCSGVHVRTLHALGFQIIREAIKMGVYPRLNTDPVTSEIDGLDRKLLYAAQRQARQQKVAWAEELKGMDADDFLNYLGQCKGGLLYADLKLANLPKAALGMARQAKAPQRLWWYDKLYQLYETIRRKEAVITFDDMLMTGWELLVRHEALRELFQARYRCVMVDEFQDVNKAQAEMLDIITEPHRNYMVIGDDDQTIYEWRGAEPAFILSFEQKYKATVYQMTRNFRCPEEAVKLANDVIKHNVKRKVKTMVADQGRNKQTRIMHYQEPVEMAADVVNRINAFKRDDHRWQDIAVLIRMYAQTPVIEQQLIGAQIPYQIVGSQPFYLRPEAMVLIDYLTVAEVDGLIEAGESLTEERMEKACRAFMRIYHQPKRYLTRDFAQRLTDSYRGGRATASKLLWLGSTDQKPFITEKVKDFAETLRWVRQHLHRPEVSTLLKDLERTIDLKEHFLENTGVEAGQEKAANVDAMIQYAEDKGDFNAFRDHLRALNKERLSASRANRDAVCITSIFRAKGREWPMVFVPQVNKDVFPPARSSNDEEERRLLYVAFTRPKTALNVYFAKDKCSPFLEVALKGKGRR